MSGAGEAPHQSTGGTQRLLGHRGPQAAPNVNNSKGTFSAASQAGCSPGLKLGRKRIRCLRGQADFSYLSIDTRDTGSKTDVPASLFLAWGGGESGENTGAHAGQALCTSPRSKQGLLTAQ